MSLKGAEKNWVKSGLLFCSFVFAFLRLRERIHRRGGGNVEIANAISKGCGKRGKPLSGFPRFPQPVISTAFPCGVRHAEPPDKSSETTRAWLVACYGPRR